MLKKIRNIAGNLVVLMLVLSVITLNAVGYGNCSKMAASVDCCHVQNTVKSCCVKNIKVNFNERLSGHCGCTMNEAPQNPDLYIDMGSNSSSRIDNAQQVNSFSMNESKEINVSAKYYSPPPKTGGNTYLEINNLRI